MQGDDRADRDLDLLGGSGADRELVDDAHVLADRLVHLVAADAHRTRHHDSPERDDRHLAGAAPHVDDHPPDRLLDLEPRPDRCRDRLLDQVDTTGAGRERGLLDSALLDLGDARRGAHDQARMGHPAIDHLADEVTQHLLGDLEVSDHAVPERPRGRDRRRRAADHPLGVGADRMHLAGVYVRRYDRRLGYDDAARRPRKRACWRCPGRSPCRGRRPWGEVASGGCPGWIRLYESRWRQGCQKWRASVKTTRQRHQAFGEATAPVRPHSRQPASHSRPAPESAVPPEGRAAEVSVRPAACAGTARRERSSSALESGGVCPGK